MVTDLVERSLSFLSFLDFLVQILVLKHHQEQVKMRGRVRPVNPVDALKHDENQMKPGVVDKPLESERQKKEKHER